MKIGVSACLLGVNCKYNGGNNFHPLLQKMLDGYDVVPVCPETAGGLPIPRVPAEIQNGTVVTRDGRNVDREYHDGAEKELSKLKEQDVRLCILQSRSPSCGVGKVYDGSFSKKLIVGNGIAAGMFLGQGIRCIDVECAEKEGSLLPFLKNSPGND